MRMGHGWLVVHRHGLTYCKPREDTMSTLLVEFIARGGSHFQPKVIMHDEKCVPKLGTDDMGQLGNRGQGGREIRESFTKAAIRVASKDIQFFPDGAKEKFQDQSRTNQFLSLEF